MVYNYNIDYAARGREKPQKVGRRDVQIIRYEDYTRAPMQSARSEALHTYVSSQQESSVTIH